MVAASFTHCGNHKICNKCMHKKCWSCTQILQLSIAAEDKQNHNKWSKRYKNDIECILWILSNCKRCPKCHLWIEKNQGSNHSTCRKGCGGCGYEFDWLCQQSWDLHGSATGGYYACHKYNDRKKAGNYLTDEYHELLYYFKIGLNHYHKSYTEWIKIMKQKHNAGLIRIIQTPFKITQDQYLMYQSFASWIKKYDALYIENNNDNDILFEKHFIRSCINFRSIDHNLVLFMTGFVRDCDITLFVPRDVVKCCINFFYDKSVNLLDEENKFETTYTSFNNQTVTIDATLLTDEKAEFIDEWNAPNGYYNDTIVITDNGKFVRGMLNQWNSCRFRVNGKYTINCIRKVWRIRVWKTRELPWTFSIGIESQLVYNIRNYKKHYRCLFELQSMCNKYMNSIIKSSDIISILFIYYNDSSGLVKFILNDQYILKNEILFDDNCNIIRINHERPRLTMYQLVLCVNSENEYFQIIQ